MAVLVMFVTPSMLPSREKVVDGRNKHALHLIRGSGHDGEQGTNMIVDVHGHLVPPDLLAAIRKEQARFPSLRLIEDGGSLALAFGAGKPSRPIMKGLSDVAGRLAWMGGQGIDRQVVGGWPDWFGYELPAAEGEAWCRLINDAQLAAAKAEPRFVPLASVPLQDGARAAAVLEGGDGGRFSRRHDHHLAARHRQRARRPRPRSVLGAAEETGAVIHIHPSYDAGDTRVNDYGLANGVGRISDAIVAVARLLCSGHVTRYRNARIFAPMGAAGLPFLLGRLRATIRSRRGSPIRPRASHCSIPTASCTIRGCCDLSWR